MSTLPSVSVVKVAVVGHTNTGKTSLLRTLTQDVGFGEVDARPGTTRHVERTVLLVGGRPLVELSDTPGLEDSIGLLEHLDALCADRSADWIDVIRGFLDTEAGQTRFEQEAKAIRQVLASDVALYVVDARDRVLGKHRDELTILGRCARPVLPVLNFTASPDARPDAWREQLMRVNMHAIAEFDTVVLNATAEQRLFEKLLTLLEPFRPQVEALIEDRRQQRRMLTQASAESIADLLLDVAAYHLIVSEVEDPAPATRRLQETVRAREQACAASLLSLFRFRPDDYEADSVPIERVLCGSDLFSQESLRQFGIRASSGAAAGGLAGLGIDLVTGGLTLGAAAALGATLGAMWSVLESHGRRLADVFRGYARLRVNDETLRLLAVRQIDLVQALLRRGHAAQHKLQLRARGETGRAAWVESRLPDVLLEARLHADWSRLGENTEAGSDDRRVRALAELARLIAASLDTARPERD